MKEPARVVTAASPYAAVDCTLFGQTGLLRQEIEPFSPVLYSYNSLSKMNFAKQAAAFSLFGLVFVLIIGEGMRSKSDILLPTRMLR